jgi:D-amino-acid dehydrogenase
MSTAPLRVVVIGSGLLGLTSAWFLCRHGHEVTVVERREGPALETSHANASLITPSLSAPVVTPAMIASVLGALVRPGTTAGLRPGALPGLVGWGLRALTQMGPRRFRRSVTANLALARYNVTVMDQLDAELGLDYHRETRGTLMIFRRRALLEAAMRESTQTVAADLASEVLDRVATIAKEPAIAPIGDQLAGGIFNPADGHGDPYLFCRGLERRATQAGVRFRYGTAVDALEHAGARITGVNLGRETLAADAVVLAAGSHSTALARTVGVRLPILPVKGFSVTVHCPGWTDAPRIPVLDEEAHLAVAMLGDRVRVAGLTEFGAGDTDAPARRITHLIEHLRRLFPRAAPFLDGAAPNAWAGLRPLSSDGVPLLGATRLENLYLNTGHGHLGWSMAAGSGKALADLMSGRRPEVDVAPYAPERFA